MLNSSGKILLERGFKSFADFILAVMATPAQCTAENIVQSLVSVFPAFADVSTYQGQQIFLLKKAQLLAADLHRRFKVRDTKLYQYGFCVRDSLIRITPKENSDSLTLIR